jgi:hypothetical protein
VSGFVLPLPDFRRSDIWLFDKGKIQQQKLIRATFKAHALPCAPIRTLWELLFNRFAELTTRVVDGVDLGLEAARHDSIPALNSVCNAAPSGRKLH